MILSLFPCGAIKMTQGDGVGWQVICHGLPRCDFCASDFISSPAWGPQMAEQEKKQQVKKCQMFTPWWLIVGGLLVWILSAAAAAGANVAMGHITADTPSAKVVVSYLLFTPSTVLGLLGVAMILAGAVRWAVFGAGGRGASSASTEKVEALLATMNQRLLLSETAKRLAYRSEDIRALRDTIRKDINQRDFDAALVLVDEMSQNYGYREEAETFRDEIITARNAEMESKISEAVARIEDILSRREFDKAAYEAAKLQRLYPDAQRVQMQVQRVVEIREQYKQDLERQFLAASERDDVDRAMDLLKELDKYLTEKEAEPFRETARGVIGKKRDNLGVQFKLSVQDKEWRQAVRVGEQIIREFPNSRMADEVRGMLDVLRQRASQQQAVSSP